MEQYHYSCALVAAQIGLMNSLKSNDISLEYITCNTKSQHVVASFFERIKNNQYTECIEKSLSTHKKSPASGAFHFTTYSLMTEMIDIDHIYITVNHLETSESFYDLVMPR